MTRPGGQPDGSRHMGAWVDGRSRRIQPRWGGITAPTHIGRGRAAARSNGLTIFLTFGRNFLDGHHCAAGRVAAPRADFSEAMAPGGWFKAGSFKPRVAGTSCRSKTFPAAGATDTPARGRAGGAGAPHPSGAA